MDQIFEKDEFELPEGELSRNQSQKVALFAIYDVLTYLNMKAPIDVKAIVGGLCGCDYEEADYFVKSSVIHAIKYYDEAVEAYNAHMKKWTFDRLNRVCQALLLLSYVHYFYFEEETDKKVVIDIAVRLAKSYLAEKDYRFVNGILDNVLVKA